MDIKSMTLPKLEDFCTGQGLAKFRAGQIFQWIHQKQANSFEQMTNLPADLRKNWTKPVKFLAFPSGESWCLR